MTENPETIEIEYETDIDESIDAIIRMHWLQTYAWRSLFLNAILVPAVVVFLIAPKLFPEHPWEFSFFFLAVWGVFLLYSYGPGYRRKLRIFLTHNLSGRPFPKSIKYRLNEAGISCGTEIATHQFPWSSVKKIGYYKNYLEIQLAGFLVQIRKEHAPDISVLNEMWERYR